MRLLAAIVLMLALGICVSFPFLHGKKPPAPASHLITHEQAAEIARAYFYQYIDMCGGTGDPVLKGDHWEVDFQWGYGGAGEPQHPILISRTTGAVTCVGYPQATDPVDLLRTMR